MMSAAEQPKHVEYESKKPVNSKSSVDRINVSATFHYGEITVRELESASACEGAPVIAGFPSVGITSSIATGYILEHLNLPLVGLITSPDNFPAACLVHDGIPSPPLRIHGDKRLVVIASEIRLPPSNGKAVASVVEAVFDFAKRHHCTEIFVLDGLPLESLDQVDLQALKETMADGFSPMRGRSPRPRGGSGGPSAAGMPPLLPLPSSPGTAGNRSMSPAASSASASATGAGSPSPPAPAAASGESAGASERKLVRFLTTSSTIGPQLMAEHHRPLHEALIQGIAGQFLSEAAFLSAEYPNVTCLLAPVSQSFPDAWGAVFAVQTLQSLLHFSVDMSPLKSKAAELEAKINSTVQEVMNAQRQKLAPPPSMYQ